MSGDLSVVEERYIFHQQTHDALTISIRRASIMPKFGEVRRKVQDLRACRVIRYCRVLLTVTLVKFLGLCEAAELLIPVGLKRVGDEAITRIDLHVTSTSQLGFVTGALD